MFIEGVQFKVYGSKDVSVVEHLSSFSSFLNNLVGSFWGRVRKKKKPTDLPWKSAIRYNTLRQKQLHACVCACRFVSACVCVCVGVCVCRQATTTTNK